MAATSKSRINAILQSRYRPRVDQKDEKKDQETQIKHKLLQGLGHVDPLIQKGVEDLLYNTNFRRRTKEEVYSSFVQGLHNKVQELNQAQQARYAPDTKRLPKIDSEEITPEYGLLKKGEDLFAFEIKEAIKERSPERIEEVVKKNQKKLDFLHEEYLRKKAFGGHNRASSMSVSNNSSASNQDIFALYYALKQKRTDNAYSSSVVLNPSMQIDLVGTRKNLNSKFASIQLNSNIQTPRNSRMVNSRSSHILNPKPKSSLKSGLISLPASMTPNKTSPGKLFFTPSSYKSTLMFSMKR